MDGKTLKEARKILGLNQEEMAAKMYVSFPTYNGYENGKNIPKNKHEIIKLILKEAGQKEDEAINEQVLKRDVKDILIDVLMELRSVRKENEEYRKAILDLTENMLKESKVNKISSGQLDLLRLVVENLTKDMDKLKKADFKSASGQ